MPTILPHLQGTKIELRSMSKNDALALLDIYGDPAVMKYTDEEPFENVETVFLMLDSVQKLLSSGESLEWAIVPAGSDTPVGTCGLHSFDALLGRAEVGCLLRKSSWGNGYMREAITLLKSFAQTTLGLKTLLADVHPDNKRARQLFRTLGFRQENPALWAMDF